MFCPRNTDLEPTRPVPPGDAAGRRGCPAPGRSVPGQPGLRPHARSSGGAEAWRVGGRGGPAGQPGGLVHRFEEDRAFSSCGVKTNRATNAPAPLSNQERRGLRGRPCSRTDISSGRPRAAEEPRNGWRAPNSPRWGTRAPESRRASSERPGDSATGTGAPGTIACGPGRPFLLRCPVPRTGQRALGGGGTVHPPRQAEKVRVQR